MNTQMFLLSKKRKNPFELLPGVSDSLKLLHTQRGPLIQKLLTFLRITEVIIVQTWPLSRLFYYLRLGAPLLGPPAGLQRMDTETRSHKIRITVRKNET